MQVLFFAIGLCILACQINLLLAPTAPATCARHDPGQDLLLEREATYVFRRDADGAWRCAVDNSYGTSLLSK